MVVIRTRNTLALFETLKSGGSIGSGYTMRADGTHAFDVNVDIRGMYLERVSASGRMGATILYLASSPDAALGGPEAGTIATGVLIATSSFMIVATESGDATDDLDTIDPQSGTITRAGRS